MNALVLTLNAGSSSLKFSAFAAGPKAAAQRLAWGQVDRIGDGPRLRLAVQGAAPRETDLGRPPGTDAHAAALAGALDALRGALPTAFGQGNVRAVGHRIVHGGPDRRAPAVLDPATLAELARLEPFAPLHQPHNLAGVRAAGAAFPDALQVGCFDTAFHRDQPWVEETYALPKSYFDEGVRRYGFHGISYDYIAGRLAEIAPDLHAGRVIVAHLGNGASMAALRGGRAIASTMGFSAAEGLPMGTRTGQIDPGVMLYFMQQRGMAAAEIAEVIYKRSGLLGLSGYSSDMRKLEASGSPEAEGAIAYFAYRIRREVGSLTAALGGLDGLVFTGGIGENSARVRAEVCNGLDWLGVAVDPASNEAQAETISSRDAAVRAMIIPTDEELMIARAALDALADGA